MSRNKSGVRIEASFQPYLRDIGKGRDGEGGHYRRNVERELNQFRDWASGGGGPDSWVGVVPAADSREPRFSDLSETVFRDYARYLANERGLKQNTTQTYYAYLSSWTGWCVTEGYLDVHYAKRSTARGPLPDDDGRRPGDQQAWSPDHRHQLTEFVTEQFKTALQRHRQTGAESRERASSRYYAIKAARDRALVYVVAYTAVRIGELLRDPSDPRRRGLRWEEVNVDDGSITVYRKKQQWDTASLPDPVVQPLEAYRSLLDPPSDRWPVFPTFSPRSLGNLLRETLADRGVTDEEIERRRATHARDLLLALDESVRPQSMTTEGARNVLDRLTDAADIDVSDPNHDYLAPHGGRRGMGEILVRSFGYTVAARYLDNSEEMVRQRYSHIEAGKLGDKATAGIEDVDPAPRSWDGDEDNPSI
ncbi:MULTISPECIES: tyrosine-type recombinase/integrase [Halobacterium]|uniref:tyrosine-type recombinase/integrase n=1 Tax=Halobacterium TaxID=2239 RepID=UPI0019662A82|nr:MULTISPECIES: phage integrase SAM-like domain-containing protein [Halobacterium]MCF2164981.1 site-specific integrase [Halobacterium salinarum]MCF2168440.1 site-specific integrase [Halobacterium salinarum]MCF2237652.1 site-specific integrase [Halobacterium salinarum]QRY21483.1 site-specific integrase [Halobacterium sp. GSL-19]WJK64843.1 phage integrase SAM-like domain-containing protein [Halobacterium salinarum]